MTILKLGSKGEDVKKLQKALNLKVDGDFGMKTEEAVKVFQKNNSITADGIVGATTWGLLKLSEDKCIDASVTYKPLGLHITKCPNRNIKYLVIHYTAGSTSKVGTAFNIYNAFVSRKASADFVVDDNTIIQCNPDIKNYYCWAIGDKLNQNSSGGYLYGKATNANVISIEMCSNCSPNTTAAVSQANHSGWYFTDATINKAIELAKIVMKKYNIPIENVIRHYDVSGKLCPGVIGWNKEAVYSLQLNKFTSQKSTEQEWDKFKSRLL